MAFETTTGFLAVRKVETPAPSPDGVSKGRVPRLGRCRPRLRNRPGRPTPGGDGGAGWFSYTAGLNDRRRADRYTMAVVSGLDATSAGSFCVIEGVL